MKFFLDLSNENPHSLQDFSVTLKQHLQHYTVVKWRWPLAETPLTWSERNVALASLLGRPLVQNETGDTTVLVYDRNPLGTMARGARYHQTREGGSIHTDNVNVPEIWHYLYLGCLNRARCGGESIIADGIKIHQFMKNEFPAELQTLTENYWWEMRGVGNHLFEAPIITYDKQGLPCFRHLRPYMEAAFARKGVEMTAKQLRAVDLLDALTSMSEFSLRFMLQPGEVVLSRDEKVLHGRMPFWDDPQCIAIDELKNKSNGVLKRTMERMWIQDVELT